MPRIKKTIDLQQSMNEILEMKNEIKELQGINFGQRKKIINLESQIDAMQAHKLRKKIEIVNIPKQGDEDVSKLFIDLAAKAKVVVKTHDIKECARMRDKNGKTGNIVVKFNSIEKRDKTLSALKKAKPTLADLSLEPNNKKIFVNELLEAKKKYLLYKTKEAAKIK